MSNEWWQWLCLIQLELHREWLDKFPKIVLIQWSRVWVYGVFFQKQRCERKRKWIMGTCRILNWITIWNLTFYSLLFLDARTFLNLSCRMVGLTSCLRWFPSRSGFIFVSEPSSLLRCNIRKNLVIFFSDFSKCIRQSSCQKSHFLADASRLDRRGSKQLS